LHRVEMPVFCLSLFGRRAYIFKWSESLFSSEKRERKRKREEEKKKKDKKKQRVHTETRRS